MSIYKSVQWEILSVLLTIYLLLFAWKLNLEILLLQTYQRPLIVESSQIKNYETSFLKDRQKSSKSFVNIVRDIVKEQTGDLKYTKEDDADDYILSKVQK